MVIEWKNPAIIAAVTHINFLQNKRLREKERERQRGSIKSKTEQKCDRSIWIVLTQQSNLIHEKHCTTNEPKKKMRKKIDYCLDYISDKDEKKIY